MLFNSYIFLLFFFPLCLAGWFGLNRLGKYTLSQVFLLAMSLWFYGYFHVGYLAIMAVSIVFNYGFTLAMEKTASQKLRKLEATLAVLLNLAILFYYKYFNFFLTNVERIFGFEMTLRTIVLPLGISFFTFQQISYVVDFYRGEVKHYPFLQYACFVSYFPQLVAGPIVTHDELIPQFLDERKKHFNWDNFSKGLFLFVLGLSKKVLLADVFGGAANWGFSNVQALDATNAILTSFAYTFQIYFDFSGYSDMAVGLGKMMNIDLPENFSSPYKALSITEFWKRWHRTLTRFLTKYIYIPLGGNRKGKVRTYVNVLIVFLASGIWHGAYYTFFLWGILHGVLSVLERAFKINERDIHPALRWLVTFGFVNLTWVLFRAETLGDAIVLCKRLVSMEFGPVNQELAAAFFLPEIKMLVSWVPSLWSLQYRLELLVPPFYLGSLLLILGCRNAYEHMLVFRPRWTNLLTISLLLALCVLSFSGVSTFLYFNF